MNAGTPKKQVRSAPRSSDDRVLEMIALKKTGVSWPAVAKAFGFAGYQTAQQLCTNVMKADLAESSEDPAVVKRAYW